MIIELLKKILNKIFNKKTKKLGTGMSFDNNIKNEDKIDLTLDSENLENKVKNNNINMKDNIIDKNYILKEKNKDDYEKRNAKYINFDENTNMFEFLVSAVITNPEYLKLQKTKIKLDEKKEEFLKLKNEINKLIEDGKN